MHCEITDYYFNKFFVELQIKKDNLKSVFWVPEFGHQNPYTGPQNNLNMSLLIMMAHFILNFLQNIVRKDVRGTYVIRDHQQITFVILNKFCPLSK